MQAAHQPARQAAPKFSGEYVHDNIYWRGAVACISVCVPVYRHDVTPLMEAIASCKLSALVELIIYDDGSDDAEALAHLMDRAGHVNAAVRIVAGALNRGRSAARNAAMRHARGEWILLLDADMTPDSQAFLEAYFNAIEAAGRPAVIVGGCSLATAPEVAATALHRWQASRFECTKAANRNMAPGRNILSSNVLFHRDVLAACPFDEAFAGWGWEELDWGLRVEKQFPVIHIDNTATHHLLDDDATLMSKYGLSGRNFSRLAIRHKREVRHMAIYRRAEHLKHLPMRNALKHAAAITARTRFLPLELRGRALNFWQALVYADAL